MYPSSISISRNFCDDLKPKLQCLISTHQKTNAAASSLSSRTLSFSLKTRAHAKIKLTRNIYHLIALKNIN
jgi:hypothetical protein